MPKAERWVTSMGECWHRERSCAERNRRVDQPRIAYPVSESAVVAYFRPCKRCAMKGGGDQ